MPSLAQSLNNQFEIFVGVDQTGATLDSGLRAKPLPIAVVSLSHDMRIRLRVSGDNGEKLKLKSFTPSELQGVFAQIGIDPQNAFSSKTAIFADCVFGLPEGMVNSREGLWPYFQEAAGQDRYGLKPAADYFASVLKRFPGSSTLSYPTRRCEKLANANSVFRTHPFQKNIQCGTFRIWRDLGLANDRWLNIRFFTPTGEATSNRPWLFEAYPSLVWRSYLRLRTRKLSELKNALKTYAREVLITDEDAKLITSDADLADAAVLAVGGFLMKQNGELFQRAPSRTSWLAQEGWIIGLPLLETKS